MTDDEENLLENYQNTFKARAKGKLKKWYIEGNSAGALDEIADQFREEAELIFLDDDQEEVHLEYVELLVDAGEKAVEESPVDPNDPELLFNRDVSMEELKRDGERFEQAIDELRRERGDGR